MAYMELTALDADAERVYWDDIGNIYVRPTQEANGRWYWAMVSDDPDWQIGQPICDTIHAIRDDA